MATTTHRPPGTKAKLERVAFTISRLAEFVGEKELVAQIGHPSDEWPVVAAKEVIDNALDEAEEAGIPPEIEVAVSTEKGEIVIADNGRGLPAETLDGVLDYTRRVSSREAYVSPSRGQQGNALKCIIAMPFALDGTHGTTVIESFGQAHRIVFAMDPVHREPKILHEIGPSTVKNGTRVTVCWPRIACHLLDAAEVRFLQTVENFATFNPHLTLRLCWNEKEILDSPATVDHWRKWRTCDPTSAYWYGIDQFQRYIAAHIAHDEVHGRTGRTVRDFISELRGLSGTTKRKAVLVETGTAEVPLSEFFKRGRDAIAGLLSACQAHTKPVKPQDLGLIGADHLLSECVALGGAEGSFKYRKYLATTPAGLPYAIEAAFAYCPEGDCGLRLITGVNFSVGIGSPFERFGPASGLTSELAEQFVEEDDPIVFILHYTCPKVEFADRGKGILTLPPEVVGDIIALVEAVTKNWAKQKRAEIRYANAEANRSERLLRQHHRAKPEPPEPTGVLAQTITSAADKLGVAIDDLIVLSRDNDPYTAYRRRPEAEWFTALFERRVDTGAVKHLRGFFYLLVSSPEPITGPDGTRFVNDYKHWQALQKASKAARWLGLIPFERIIDERNPEAEIYMPGVTPILTGVSSGTGCEIPPTVDAALPTPYITGFAGRQTHRIIFYGEKSSLAVVLRPIAEQIGAEMILVTGESSDRRIAEAVKRASQDGRPAVVLYFADFDPSGHEMPANVGRKLQALRDLYHPDLDITLYQVALTLDQIRTLRLPSSPLKPTEKRGKRWREKMGHEQTEIDAMVELHPEALRQAVFDALRPFYDAGLDARVGVAESAWQERAEQKLRSHLVYQQGRQWIAAMHEQVSAAAEDLHNQQHRLAARLADTIPPPPPLPEAQPGGTAKPALFDSDSDYVTATRRLRRHKRLDDVEDEDEPLDDEDEDDGLDEDEDLTDAYKFMAQFEAPTIYVNQDGTATTELSAKEDGEAPAEAAEPATPPRRPARPRPRGSSPILQAARSPDPPVRRRRG